MPSTPIFGSLRLAALEIHFVSPLQKEKTGFSLSFLFVALFAYSEQTLDAEKKPAKVSHPHLRFLALIHFRGYGRPFTLKISWEWLKCSFPGDSFFLFRPFGVCQKRH